MKLRFQIWLVACSLTLFLAPVLRAGSLDSSVLQMFPKNVTEFAYADIGEARKLPWFAQFEQQALPAVMRDFEESVTTPGMQSELLVDQVAWAIVSTDEGNKSTPVQSGQIAGVAIGDFQPVQAEASLHSQNLITAQMGSRTLFSVAGGPDGMFFAFMDEHFVAFGPRKILEHMIRAHDGEEDSLLENTEMLTRITQADGGGIFWGVLNASAARMAVGQLVPEAAAFPQAAQLIGKMNALLITVSESNGMEAHFQAVSASPDDALLLSQLLQAGVLVRRYESKQENPELVQLLDGLRIDTNGNLLDISFNLSDDQMTNLVHHNIFAIAR
jgi:hypothetical protein